VNLLDGIHAILDEDPLPVRPASNPRLLGVFRYLGQSAIAASVALGVLFAAQYLAPQQEGGGPALAGAGGLAPVATTGEYQAGELTRTASFTGENRVLDDDTRDRLTQAVYREFERGAANYQVPVNYVPREN